MRKFTKRDLRTGDIAVQRDGIVQKFFTGTGFSDCFVISQKASGGIGGINLASGFNDDLTWVDSAYDIMAVYRPKGESFLTSFDYKNEAKFTCVFERSKEREEKKSCGIDREILDSLEKSIEILLGKKVTLSVEEE